MRTFALASLLIGCPVAGAEDRLPRRIVTPGKVPLSAVSQLPLSFEPNLGQAPSSDSYVARSGGMQVGFSKSSFSLLLPSTTTPQNLGIRLVGANQDPQILPSEKSGGQSNYLLRNRPFGWKTHIPR